MKHTLLAVVAFFCFSVTAQQQFTVYFDTGKDLMNPDSERDFQSWLISNKDLKIFKIYGYTDRHSTAEMNLELSQRRANAVYRLLAKSDNIMLDKVEIKGFGENTALTGNDQQQRKVVIWYEGITIEQPVEMPIANTGTVTKFSLGRQRVKAQVGDKIRLKSLGFFPGSDKVMPECYPVLDDLLKAMFDNPRLKIQIQGHICCSPANTHSLARARAQTIYDYLVKKGIDKSRLSYTDFGGSKPIYPLPENNEMEREINRRVEIEIIEN